MKSTAELLKHLLVKGGSIHRANDVSANQLVGARAQGNFTVDGEGNSFVWLPRELMAGRAIGFGVLPRPTEPVLSDSQQRRIGQILGSDIGAEDD